MGKGVLKKQEPIRKLINPKTRKKKRVYLEKIYTSKLKGTLQFSDSIFLV